MGLSVAVDHARDSQYYRPEFFKHFDSGGRAEATCKSDQPMGSPQGLI